MELEAMGPVDESPSSNPLSVSSNDGSYAEYSLSVSLSLPLSSSSLMSLFCATFTYLPNQVHQSLLDQTRDHALVCYLLYQEIYH